MRVSQVAKQLNISASTVRKYTREGKLDHTLNPAGQRVYTQEAINKFLGIPNTLIRVHYVRSSSGSKDLLEAQKEELLKAYGEPLKVYSDSGSGLNENRVNLQRLLKDASRKKFNQVCVTYEDRLARFGVSYLKQLLAKDGIELVVLHDQTKYSVEEELLQDFMNLIASFSGKFYRLRSKQAQNQLLDKAKEKLTHE
jgi:putative resolvase